MKINYVLVSRSLIALLFVVAGIQKLIHFSDTANSIASLNVPLAGLATLIVIVIEVPVAIAFAWGYKTCITGWILIGYTILVTLLVHGHISQGVNLVMALKNIAIIGGLLLAIDTCCCGNCPGSKKTGHHGHDHNNQNHSH
jgi:putative oxidoreductase